MSGKILLEKLGKRIGLDLKLSRDGTCAVNFDGHEIFFEEDGDHLYLYAILGKATDQTESYKIFLEANYLGLKTGLSTIGLDTERGELVLHMLIMGEMSYEDFEAHLSLFVKNVRLWKEKLSRQ